MMMMMTRHMPEQDRPTTAKDFGRDPIPMGVFINQVSVRVLYFMNFKNVLTALPDSSEACIIIRASALAFTSLGLT